MSRLRARLLALALGTAVASLLALAVLPRSTRTATDGKGHPLSVLGAPALVTCSVTQTLLAFGTIPSPFVEERCAVSIRWPGGQALPEREALSASVSAAAQELPWDELTVIVQHDGLGAQGSEPAEETLTLRR